MSTSTADTASLRGTNPNPRNGALRLLQDEASSINLDMPTWQLYLIILIGMVGAVLGILYVIFLLPEHQKKRKEQKERE